MIRRNRPLIAAVAASIAIHLAVLSVLVPPRLSRPAEDRIYVVYLIPSESQELGEPAEAPDPLSLPEDAESEEEMHREETTLVALPDLPVRHEDFLNSAVPAPLALDPTVSASGVETELSSARHGEAGPSPAPETSSAALPSPESLDAPVPVREGISAAAPRPETPEMPSPVAKTPPTAGHGFHASDPLVVPMLPPHRPALEEMAAPLPAEAAFTNGRPSGAEALPLRPASPIDPVASVDGRDAILPGSPQSDVPVAAAPPRSAPQPSRALASPARRRSSLSDEGNGPVNHSSGLGPENLAPRLPRTETFEPIGLQPVVEPRIPEEPSRAARAVPLLPEERLPTSASSLVPAPAGPMATLAPTPMPAEPAPRVPYPAPGPAPVGASARPAAPGRRLVPEPVPGELLATGALLHFEEPHYPRPLRRRGIEGFVEVTVHLDGQGNVTHWHVDRFEPDAALKAEVERVVPLWRFYVAPEWEREGAVPPPVTVRIEFRLDE